MKTRQLVFTTSYKYAMGAHSFEGYWCIQYLDGNVAREVLPGDTSMYGDTLYVDLQFLRTFLRTHTEKNGYFFKLSPYYERTKRFIFTARRVA